MALRMLRRRFSDGRFGLLDMGKAPKVDQTLPVRAQRIGRVRCTIKGA
jgi:hypothetical protein